MKTVFVTGGAGYVGAVLVPKLLAKGHSVKVLDLFIFEGAGFPESDALECVEGDIRNQDLLREIIPGSDALIHLAAISTTPASSSTQISAVPSTTNASIRL